MTSSSTASKAKGKVPPKSSKHRSAVQQLSLSSFFKGAETIASKESNKKGDEPTSTVKTKNGGGSKLKGSKGELDLSTLDRGVISIDDSSDDDQPEQDALVSKSTIPARNIIDVDDSDSDSEALRTRSSKKRKASSIPQARLSTPPPSNKSTSISAPGTPSKMLKLTAPLNPSPSKRQRTYDLFRSGNSNINPDDVVEEPKPSTSMLFGQATMLPSSSSKALPVISATANTTAPVLDFDTDPFLFRPETVDTSGWPGGRLPYEVLVGIYLQVGGTRSRLAIVRIISK